MSKIDVVRAAMVQAMKAKDKARKDSLSMLLSALKNAEIDKREPLTEAEEDAIVKKEIRQTQETYDLAPADRDDIREEAGARLAVYKEFAPEDMSVDQIKEVIDGVLKELGIENPTPKDKGAIMKVLMPKVKGKADANLGGNLTGGYIKLGVNGNVDMAPANVHAKGASKLAVDWDWDFNKAKVTLNYSGNNGKEKEASIWYEDNGELFLWDKVHASSN